MNLREVMKRQPTKAQPMKVAKGQLKKTIGEKEDQTKKKPAAANKSLAIVPVEDEPFDLTTLDDDEDAPPGVDDTRGISRSQRWIWESQYEHLDDATKNAFKAAKTMAEKNKIRNKVCPRGVNKNDKKGVIMIRKGLISATAEIKSSNQDYSR